MESDYQKQSLKAFLELFLKAQGSHRPEHCQVKSASALSRFLNHYVWSARAIIRQVRYMIRQQLSQYHPRCRRPHLQVIVDLTTLEKLRLPVFVVTGFWKMVAAYGNYISLVNKLDFKD